MKVLLGIHKWKLLPSPSTFGCTKYMHSRVNICSTHIYPIPTSCSNHAGWQKTISHILALGDPPVKLTVDSIMQWRYHIKNMQWSYPIKNMLGEEKRKHWTLWGSKRRQHNGVNVGGFSEPCDPDDVEVSTGWWTGSPVGLLPWPQSGQLHFHLSHTLGVQMKSSSEKKTYFKKSLKTHQSSPTLSFYCVRDSERLGWLFRTVTG